MKAARIIGPDDIRIMDVPRPAAGPKDVLARVCKVGICGTDLAILSGEMFAVKEGLIRYPITPGHEWSGVVEEVGEMVRDFAPGDRVVGDTGVSCGDCPDCLAGDYNVCKNGYGVGTIGNWDGAYADYIIMPERHMYHIPPGVSFEEAALVEPASIAGYTVERGGVKMGDIVVVQGTGAIGLICVQLAKMAGASLVILSGRKEAKLEVGRSTGADITVNILEEDLVETVKDVTPHGRGADVVLEASGSLDALRDSFAAVRPGGVIASVSFYEKKMNEVDIDRLVLNDITLCGVGGCPGMFPRILRLLASKRLSLTPVITHRFPFSQLQQAIRATKELNDTRIKILLEM